MRGSRQLKGRKAALVLVAVEKRGRGTGRARMEVILDFKSTTFIDFLKYRLLKTKCGARYEGVHRRSEKLHRAAGGWFQARAT